MGTAVKKASKGFEWGFTGNIALVCHLTWRSASGRRLSGRELRRDEWGGELWDPQGPGTLP